MSAIKAAWRRFSGKRQRAAVVGRWFYAALLEANLSAGRLAYQF